ncbi:hypothetical protein NTB88_12390 [Aeromonas salmonicida]|nr:hypothetical protein [Aeromonas salmonicida]
MNAWRSLWAQAWNFSEWSGIRLGRFAPWVFHQMIGCDRKVSRQRDDKGGTA